MVGTRDVVYRIVSHIPRGRVMTYGDVARLAGTGPRAVGRYLHENPDPKTIPCHRVVDSSGRMAKSFAFGGARGQITRLQNEGVAFLRRGDALRCPDHTMRRPTCVDLDRCLWTPSRLFREYLTLFRRFGDPGPWPWFGQDAPHSPEEIAIGAILTQNTN
ncbi:MAG TPA: methylated-DNA--[protein]-cysteine S-methyltransferase, partial [Candidatus Methylomirabilis sp.]|nr:methylated-DNA--[protein]-cysteine S-methyltransferase [Candidatus Methylomirabilis sp.]